MSTPTMETTQNQGQSQNLLDASKVTGIRLIDGSWVGCKNARKVGFAITSSPADSTYPSLQYVNPDSGKSEVTPLKHILSFEFASSGVTYTESPNS